MATSKYPSHFLPVFRHLRHVGLASSHLTLRTLVQESLVSRVLFDGILLGSEARYGDNLLAR